MIDAPLALFTRMDCAQVIFFVEFFVEAICNGLLLGAS